MRCYAWWAIWWQADAGGWGEGMGVGPMGWNTRESLWAMALRYVNAGPVSSRFALPRYSLPDEELRGRLELTFFDSYAKGIACNLDSEGEGQGGVAWAGLCERAEAATWTVRVRGVCYAGRATVIAHGALLLSSCSVYDYDGCAA